MFLSLIGRKKSVVLRRLKSSNIYKCNMDTINNLTNNKMATLVGNALHMLVYRTSLCLMYCVNYMLYLTDILIKVLRII